MCSGACASSPQLVTVLGGQAGACRTCVLVVCPCHERWWGQRELRSQGCWRLQVGQEHCKQGGNVWGRKANSREQRAARPAEEAL